MRAGGAFVQCLPVRLSLWACVGLAHEGNRLSDTYLHLSDFPPVALLEVMEVLTLRIEDREDGHLLVSYNTLPVRFRTQAQAIFDAAVDGTSRGGGWKAEV